MLKHMFSFSDGCDVRHGLAQAAVSPPHIFPFHSNLAAVFSQAPATGRAPPAFPRLCRGPPSLSPLLAPVCLFLSLILWDTQEQGQGSIVMWKPLYRHPLG